jgi:ArsR family transcriptional regulator, arsenate/arsenite/antimonite-responsive transcriptional repressor
MNLRLIYIPLWVYRIGMELVQIYECLCDTTRLRLLNVLGQGPLCVCHFQEILDEPQVKISKHLAYLRKRGLVEAEREGNWMVYSLPKKPTRELKANLACLQDCAQENPHFRGDLTRLKKLAPHLARTGPAACGCHSC